MTHRILSGIQPTGHLHLGNYLGAICNWLTFQDQHECLFCIVDLHALTVPIKPSELRSGIRSVAAAYIAAGINPKKSAIFQQSSVPGHSELAWLLGCLTPMGWLNRMTQFKEKAGKHKEKASLGLYAYPVLMAADILLYRATHVPVGDDQKQHLELSRDIAAAFNHRHGQDYFPLPEPEIFGSATRVMSLRDGANKMSKSDPSDFSRILLLDDADTIALKIRKAKTDADVLPENEADLEGRPEANNLVNIYAALSGVPRQQVCQQFAGQNFSAFKPALTEILVEQLRPIGKKIEQLLKDPAFIDATLAAGAQQANKIAQETMRSVHKMMGVSGGCV
ncbi:MAG: tryptophan--tRNA ligase [Pseudomonadota bacterium]